ncbi:MAG: TonB-dependent receptor [Acidobacteriota bacterium]
MSQPDVRPVPPCRPPLVLLVFLALALMVPAGVVLAQTAAESPDGTGDEAKADSPIEDVIVVTASRTEQRLLEAPVAVSVISSEDLETLPADDYGDVLRSVPGLNVSQISARDVQIDGRGPASSLSNSQLVLLDGRSVYLDFFGFVMWDLLPIDFREVSQIEVVRGPGSAVWGANALGGVVNLITKSPWELAGTTVQAGGGELSTAYASVTHAGAADTSGYKISLSYFEQDAYDRPTGFVPGTTTPYPPFENEGTEQPKLDLRWDRNFADGEQLLTLQAGYAGTDGIVHSGIGPFDLDSASRLAYGKATWNKAAATITGYANLVEGDATNLLTRGADGLPLLFDFKSDVYHLEASNSTELGRHFLTYGGNVRSLEFDLSIAPAEDSREEFGFFVQDEIELSERLTWLVGARLDDIDPTGTVVSPRTSLVYLPTPDHSLRISYNEAFRAPSLIENFLDTTIVNTVTLPVVGLYAFPSIAFGNPELQEESLTAYEAGYVGNFAEGRVTVSAAIYRNEREDATDFFPSAAYDPTNPPPGFPFPPLALAVPPLAGALPSEFTYRNIGETVNQGIELSFDYRPSLAWKFNVNYSYQDEPDVTGISIDETNIPPENRFNAGISYNGPRWYTDATLNFVDEARFTDVLDERFWGTTESYTMVNLTVGIRLLDDRLSLAVIGNNIFDEDIQQHIFGDIISRKVSGQIRFEF